MINMIKAIIARQVEAIEMRCHEFSQNLCSRNGINDNVQWTHFNDACLNFSLWVLHPSGAVNSVPWMRSDPQDIIPDYCQCHTFDHLQFISDRSSRCKVWLTLYFTTRGVIFLSCLQNRDGFEAKYNMKIFARRLTSWDTDSLVKRCRQFTVSVSRVVYFLHF